MWATMPTHNHNYSKSGSRWWTFSQVNVFVNHLFTVLKNSIRQLNILYFKVLDSDSRSRPHLLLFCKFTTCGGFCEIMKFLSFFGQYEGGIPTYCTSIIHSMTAVYCDVCTLASLGIPGPKLLTCYYRVATKGHLRCHWNNWSHWQSYPCGTQRARVTITEMISYNHP